MPEQETRIVVVTGGSRGIGRAICLSLAGAGTRIWFNYHAADAAAQETMAGIAAAGGIGVARKVDISSAAAVSAFFDEVLADAGRLDVLVNNAGITRDGLLVRMKESDWDAVVDINLKGAFLCTKAAAKPMIKQRGGRIINITSVVGLTGNPGQVNYSASKAGIIGLTRATAKELASRQITVNAVAPGYIETDMTAAMTAKARESMIAAIPMGRVGNPQDVAAAVCFLASATASYITGQVLHVNGGFYP
jgi:3-oxoacyl-[acyl-carrier protein] reductase